MQRDYYAEMKETYENAIRSGKGDDTKKIVSTVCPETYHKQCKLCEKCKNILFNKAKYSTDLVEKASELNRKEKFYANIILLTNPSEVVVFEYGPTIGNKLVSYEMDSTSDYKGFMDPYKGRNMVIVKIPNVNKKLTKYDIEPRVATSALPNMGVLQAMFDLDTVMEQLKTGSFRTLPQSKLPDGKTEIRILPSWLGKQFSSVFQLKYKIHYHVSDGDMVHIQSGAMDPLVDIIVVPPQDLIESGNQVKPEIRSNPDPSQELDWGTAQNVAPRPIRPSVIDYSPPRPVRPGPLPIQVGETYTAGETYTTPMAATGSKPSCFGTWDPDEPECTITCKKDGFMDRCKEEWETKAELRRKAKGLYR